MTVITHRTTETTHSVSRHVPGPLHATLLGGTVPLFLGALLSDLAYLRSYHVQWSNFAAWLIAGGLLFGGLAMFFALVNLARAHKDRASAGLSPAADGDLAARLHRRPGACQGRLGDHAPRSGAVGAGDAAGRRGKLGGPVRPARGR